MRTLIGHIKGPKGDTGATGATGPVGPGATVTVGTVSTTAYGNMAEVTNSGTATDAVLDFVIPQGKPGEQTTKMSGLILNTVTASSETYPIPATGETGATVFGKIIKFFNDTKTAIASKVNVSDIVNNLTSNAANKPLSAAQGKALNDAITNVNDAITTVWQEMTLTNKFSSSNTRLIVQNTNVVKVFVDATVGGTDIAAWTLLGYWNNPITVNSARGVSIVSVHDATDGTDTTCYAAFHQDGHSFSLSTILKANHRYWIGFCTVY